MLASVVIRASELLAVLLAAGSVTLVAGFWRLRQAAGDADRCLSVSRCGAGQGGSAAVVSEVVVAAGVIAEAAASAAAAMTHSAYQDLAGDARREAEALAAGIAVAASLPGGAGGQPVASAAAHASG